MYVYVPDLLCKGSERRGDESKNEEEVEKKDKKNKRERKSVVGDQVHSFPTKRELSGF